MKKISLILLLLLFISINSYSQNKSLDHPLYYAYCELNDTRLEFGGTEKYWLEKEPRLRISKSYASVGSIRFHTFIDGLNYMSDLGWRVVQVYKTGSSDSTRALLCKQISREESTKLCKEISTINIDNM